MAWRDDVSAERLALALRAAQLGPWEWEVRTDMVTFSERAAELFGVAPGPVMTWAEMQSYLHEDDRAPTALAVVRAIETNGDYAVEYRVHAPNGRFLWIAASGKGVYDAHGVPVGMIGLVQDITERKRIDAQLAEERRALETIDAIGKLLTAELDLEKLLQRLTDLATQSCGAQVGAFFHNVIDKAGESYMLYTLSGVPRDAFAGFAMPRNTAVFGPTFAGEAIVRSPDITADPRYGHSAPHHGMPTGHVPVRSYLASPVRSKTGVVLGGLFFGHADVGRFTERHEQMLSGIAAQASIAIDNAHLYQDAQARAEALVRADRHKDDFLAMLAHELRNPLAAVASAVELLAMTTPDDPAHGRALAVAKRQVAHQKQLVDDLLDVSRIARGKILLQLEPVDIVELVRQTADDHRSGIASAGLRLTLEVPADPIVVTGDRVRLVQVIGNLLDNARKFTRSGGAIRVSASVVGAEVIVAVTDTGVGIEPEFLPTLMQPFTQVERTLARSQGGLGLGLAVVKGIAELHPGGRVDVASRGLGFGSEFRLLLPVSRPP